MKYFIFREGAITLMSRRLLGIFFVFLMCFKNSTVKTPTPKMYNIPNLLSPLFNLNPALLDARWINRDRSAIIENQVAWIGQNFNSLFRLHWSLSYRFIIVE